jgi:aspartyl protease family protein
MHRLYIILLGAVGAMSLLAAAFSMSQPEQTAPVAAATTAAAIATPEGWHDNQALTLKRDSSGQFHVTAQVNGESVKFLVDTGADIIALMPEEAEALGLEIGEMQPIMQTASGVGYGALVTIDEIEVAGTVLHNVDAIVAQDLPVNLLGQSVLKQLGGVEMKGDRMVLRPR